MQPMRLIGGLSTALLAALMLVTTPPAATAGRKFCPPGLAKKGCIPPGQRKKWGRGEYIPNDVVYHRVYYNEYHLPAPREDQFYAKIGGDIYLLAEATQRVIEAINLVDQATR
ncbi:MAG TPA: RcnB family protein [Thermohalobaculum sp.]|nr:RcnB family protein [Thermohalobaculum sp.]